jgi:hypothetical protein
MTFKHFYRAHYIPEHQHPGTIALHFIGTVAALVLLGLAATVWPLWSALLFPVVHVAPGLIGHRLFERNAAVGDVRVTRKDVPLWWFVVGNHILTARILTWRSL